MIALSDHLLAAGATLTFHYTHPSRSVAMQIALAARLDFTSPSPQNFVRASVFFTGYVANGVAVNLRAAAHGAPPEFRAAAVTEVSGALLADNCTMSAVITQVDQTGTAGTALVGVAVTTIKFAQSAGGPPLYTHIVKTWPGGRVVSQQEATDTARANAQSFAIDISQAVMSVMADTEPG